MHAPDQGDLYGPVASRADEPNARRSGHPAPLWTRVAQTFVAPRRLFEGFGGHAPWLGALALSTLLAMIAAATQPEQVFLEQMEGAVTRRGEPVEITSPPAEIVRWGRYLALFSAAAAHPMIALAVAGVLTLLFTVLGGGGVGLTRYLAVASHALLISGAGAMIHLVARELFATPLQSNLGVLVPSASEHTLFGRVLQGIDLFQVWAILVLAVGVAVLDHRRSVARAAAILLAIYLLADVLTAALV